MSRFLWSVGSAIVVAGVGLAQSPGAGPRFEVAAVKPAQPGLERTSMEGGPLPVGPFNLSGHSPGRITWSNVWLERMIQVAYDFPLDRISGPDWLNTERYDIVASFPGDITVADFRLMVQHLLEERFKLTVRRETKEVSGYALEVARNGLKIKESKDTAALAAAAGETKLGAKADQACQGCNALVVMDQNGFPAPRPGNPYFPPGAGFEDTMAVNGRYRSTVLNAPMPEIAAFLGHLAGTPAQDQTGLTGKYDIHLEFLPRRSDPAGAADPGANSPAIAADPGPDLLDAVQSQLGLKLTSKKVPVEVLVIDHAERVPAGN